MSLGLEWSASLTISTIAVAVSFLAASVSAFSFYLTRVKPGRLAMVGNPPSYGVHKNRLRLPLTISNAGARTAVVPGLRLKLSAECGGTTALAYSRCSNVDPRTEPTFFQPEAVEGGATRLFICEFRLEKHALETFAIGVHDIQVQVVKRRTRRDLGPKPEWEYLDTIRLYVGEEQRGGFKVATAHWNGLSDKDLDDDGR